MLGLPEMPFGLYDALFRNRVVNGFWRACGWQETKDVCHIAAGKSCHVAIQTAEVVHEFLKFGTPFIQVAGLSGALAVALGAYGAHAFKQQGIEDRKIVFETANRYHFLHTLALLSMPLCHRRYLTGSLMILGMTLFSGTCYYHSLTGNTYWRFLTPYGGMTLIVAWLTMML